MIERLWRQANTMQLAIRRTGVVTALKWGWLRRRMLRKAAVAGEWQAHPRQASHPLAVGLGETSDLLVFEQIFISEEYYCLHTLKHISLVIDLGANVGFSSAYFLSCFPDATVVAVEPGERNVRLCKRNLTPYGSRAIVLHGAAWSECTKLRLSDESFGDGLDWSTQVQRATNPEQADVQAWDLGTLIEMSGREEVDLLKVDIERAELEVFGASSRAWLPKVRNICIELHGEDCKEAFLAAMTDFDFEFNYSGELAICLNLRLRK